MSKFKVGDKVKLIEVPELRSFNWYKNNFGKVMTVKKACGSSNEVVENPFGFSDVWLEPAANSYELHITSSDGKTTNAVYKVNGKIEKRAEAVCAPSDTFSFNAGTELAINRVLYGTDYNPKDVALKPTQPIAPQVGKGKFKVGQKVEVIGNCCCHGYSRGTILTLVRSVNFLRREPDWYVGEGTDYVSERDIEPYTEPEKEPEPVYYSGKVVCTKSKVDFLTTGKVYTFKNGLSVDNAGDPLPFSEIPIENARELQCRSFGDFVPYLGE